MTECLVCGKPLQIGQTAWHLVCLGCHYEKSTLAPNINEASSHKQIDEAQRLTGLVILRKRNFSRLVGVLSRLKPGVSPTLLDVGCAHGWFLEAAGINFRALGIEPDRALFEKAEEKGLDVRHGFFPEALGPDETFDVITFNDVFEHLPNIDTALIEIRGRLRPGGLLLINLPSSQGIFYQLAKQFFRLGFVGPFKRLWQEGLPSPHLHYFNSDNLQSLVTGFGFVHEMQGDLPSLTREGLFKRISYASDWPLALRATLGMTLWLLLPIINLLPRDIVFHIFRRKN